MDPFYPDRFYLGPFLPGPFLPDPFYRDPFYPDPRDVLGSSRTGNEPCRGVLNGLQSLELIICNAVQHGVAVIKTRADKRVDERHGCLHVRPPLTWSGCANIVTSTGGRAVFSAHGVTT